MAIGEEGVMEARRRSEMLFTLCFETRFSSGLTLTKWAKAGWPWRPRDLLVSTSLVLRL